MIRKKNMKKKSKQFVFITLFNGKQPEITKHVE